jgi:SlyX protein
VTDIPPGDARMVDSPFADHRITELEIKVAFLEDTIKQLDDEVYRQQRQIERLETLCARLAQDMQAMADRVGPASTEQEIPPHY